MGIFDRFKSIESIDNRIAELRKLRTDLLARREALIIDSVDHPERIDGAGWTKLDMQLQGIPSQISALEAQREELALKERRVQYNKWKAAFIREAEIANAMAVVTRREVMRAQLIPQVYRRFLTHQTQLVTGYQHRASDLLKTLGLPPDELDTERDALSFYSDDLGGNMTQFDALQAELLTELIAEIEQRFNVKLEVQDA